MANLLETTGADPGQNFPRLPRKILKAIASMIFATAPAAAQSPIESQPHVPAAILQISVNPARSFMVPGHIATCTEIDAKSQIGASIDGSVNDTSLELGPRRASAESVAEPSAARGALWFPRFTLEHLSEGELKLSYAIVRVTLPDRDFEFTMGDDEFANLLATPDLKLTGRARIVSNDSHDPHRQMAGVFAPCGLVVNDIPLIQPDLKFRAPVEIRVLGYEHDTSGNDVPVEAIAHGEVDYNQ